jgi:hypothetical protein
MADYAPQFRRQLSSMPADGNFIFPQFHAQELDFSGLHSSELMNDDYGLMFSDDGLILLGDDNIYIPRPVFVPEDMIYELADDSGAYLLLGDNYQDVLQADEQGPLQAFTPQDGSYSPIFVLEGQP